MLTHERINELRFHAVDLTNADKPLGLYEWNKAKDLYFARAIEAEATAPLLARIAELDKALAECRDAYPVPEVGSALESLWAQAMGDPKSVSAYVKARALSAAPAAQPDKVLVDLDVLEAAADALGSFCSDHGWSDGDMQNLDNLLAFIAQHKAKHVIKDQP